MWKDYNLGEEGWRQYKMEIVRTHQSALTGQVHEAVTMMLEQGNILNDKNEYNRCLIPTLEVKGAGTESQAGKQARADRQTAAKRQFEAADTHREQTRTKRHSTESRDREPPSTQPEKHRRVART